MKREKRTKKAFFAEQSIVAWLAAFCLLFIFVHSTNAAEDSLLAPKPSILWLSDDVNLSVFGDNEYDSFLGTSEFWSNKWGISAKLLDNDSNDIFGLPQDSQYFNLDVKRRFGSKDKSNFELGLGWQELNIDSQFDASGPKVSFEGRFKFLKSFQLYGSTSYFPELEDDLNDNTAKGYEFEAGLLYSPLPSFSLKAGYRVFNLDLEDPEIEELGSSTGFLLGSDWSW